MGKDLTDYSDTGLDTAINATRKEIIKLRVKTDAEIKLLRTLEAENTKRYNFASDVLSTMALTKKLKMAELDREYEKIEFELTNIEKALAARKEEEGNPHQCHH